MNQNTAIHVCKKMNAGLPLPKSKGEAAEYLKITGSENVWMGLTDPTKSGNMAAWKDLDGNPIGNRYVNWVKGHIFYDNKIQLNISINIITDSTESLENTSVAYNRMGMEQLHSIWETDLYGIHYQPNYTRVGVYKK